MRLLSAVLLFVLALGTLLSERFVLFVSGYRPLESPSVAALDSRQDPDDRQPPRFLAERNRVELVVPRDMTVGELLHLYQIDFAHIRRQIAEQEGIETAPDAHRLDEGTVLVLELTPVQENVP